MPNLNEIAEFRKELKNIAQEEKITSRWRERVYDELSPPDPAAVPEIDIDALLSSAGTDEPAQADTQTNTASDAVDMSENSEPAETTDSMFDDFTSDIFDTGDATSATSDGSDYLSGFDSDFPPLETAEESADSEDEPQNFDDFLSSFDFDDLPATPDDTETVSGNLGETDLPDISDFDLDTLDADLSAPSPSASELPEDDFTADTFDDDMLSELESIDDAESAETPSENFDTMLSSLDFDSIPEAEPLESLDDTDLPGGETLAPDLSDFDFSGFDTPANETDPELEILQEAEPADSSFAAASFDSPLNDTDTADTNDSSDFNFPDDFNSSMNFDAPPHSETAASATDLPDLSGMEELSLFSEDRSEFDENAGERTPEAETTPFDDAEESLDAFDDQASDSDYGSFSDTESDTGFEGLSGFGMPGDVTDSFFTQQTDDESTDESGFSLEENVLDTAIPEVTDDQFNLPDNFKDFSADSHHRLFDSVIARSTGSSGDGDALTISDDEYFAFLNRLESFPLNVQLAIQDYIGNGDDSPENKMAFVRLILSKTSLRKIAHKLEKILNKSIPIPRGFHRKSVEEYEREKKTFKYWFMHRFLPVAVMSGIALIMIFCISVLSWQFIYKPVTSESLYKTGYAYLENNQYETAVEKFNKAGEYKRKRKWYFAYARAFRKKKQFTAAEKIYTRLIYDFNYDKQGSLEYADMLSTDLRNYEKAEFVLRRRLLDQHVNDKDGLLALGDVYMNWADEDPEKYETAVKIYSRLIELYGENDTFLVRMMRYFIRTDNLAEVLVLKERFLPRLSKIDPADITELSGYLLEKRYNPKPLDSEKLRMQIDDVRMLLEKAVQADKTMPEAYYNLGRFFIYNHKQDAAIENLTEAIKRFETAAPMTARRTIRFVDAMRLLGEQFVAQKKYLDAQTLYAEALNIYREYTAFKPLPPNKIIGKLYADYGDIDYFISYNFDSALDSYQNAVKELHNTPSVYYRIGYIHYQQENYPQAIEAMSIAYADKPNDKSILYGFGNVLFKRGDYFAAQSSYEQLMKLLDAQRARKGRLFPNTRPDDAVFIEQYMHTANNLGATLNRLSERTGDSQKNARALALFAEATRAWDSLTRNPETMIRSKSVGLAYLNIQNMVNPRSTYNSEIYTDIPMILENEKPLEQKEDK